MKKFILVFLLLSQTALAETIQINVSGMVCSMCIQGIKKKFSQQKNLSHVDVDLDKKVVTLEAEHEHELSDEKIKTLINEAGYEVISISRR